MILERITLGRDHRVATLTWRVIEADAVEAAEEVVAAAAEATTTTTAAAATPTARSTTPKGATAGTKAAGSEEAEVETEAEEGSEGAATRR